MQHYSPSLDEVHDGTVVLLLATQVHSPLLLQRDYLCGISGPGQLNGPAVSTPLSVGLHRLLQVAGPLVEVARLLVLACLGQGGGDVPQELWLAG